MNVTTITAKNPENRIGNTVIEQARIIAGSLGVYTAARYLALRGYSLEASMYLLVGK